MARLYDLARMTTATTGTGTITLGSAVASYLTFAQAGVANGDTVTYAIEDGASREIGRGVYTSSGTTLTRATILRSTNSNAAISLSGSAQVFIAAAAEDIAPQTAAEQLTVRTTLYAAPLDALSCNNLIINGAMDISQRYAAVLQNIDSNLNYIIDQWEERVTNSNSGAYNYGQISLSSFALAGFKNGLQFKATTGAAMAAGDYAYFEQKIEGNRVARLAFGTASAMQVTIGFWVRCTITGTMSVVLKNTATGSRSYVLDVTISAANTWEYKTVTFPGDTSGTWATDITVGMVVIFCFACGSTFATAPGSWVATSNIRGSTNQTNFLASTNNICVVTGVSAFAGGDVPNSANAALAQPKPWDDLNSAFRYFYAWNTEAITNAMVGVGRVDTGNTTLDCAVRFPQRMLTTPSLSVSAASHFQVNVYGNTGGPTAIALNNANNSDGNLACTISSSVGSGGTAGYLRSNDTAARLYYNARM